MSFYKYISDFYDRIFPFSVKKKNFFENFFTEQSGRFLDIGCATGELVFFAREAGWSCTGIDNDENLLAIAEEKNKEKGSGVNFQNIDMRECGRNFNGESFDIVTSMGNTIVHLGSYGEIRDLAGEIFKILKSGGSFIGQIMNYEKIIKNRGAKFPVFDDGKIQFIRKYEFSENEKRIKFRMKIGDVSEKKFFTSDVFLYPLTPGELNKILSEAGFKKFDLYGSFAGEKFTPDSDTLIFKAVKG
ncbi:MAG: class I SAM-dependent methyltransferase [Acidobacteriota bacterium]